MNILFATGNPHKVARVASVLKPRGSSGFGWDSIFQPNGSGKTFAEMTSEETEAINMRKLAALKLKDYLDSHNL